MKTVLIIAYYFPPSGGPGVQRVLKNVRYLREFGWEPIVFTVENGHFPARDESLLEHIPPTIKIYRSKIIEPYRAYKKIIGKSQDTAIDVNVIKHETQEISYKERFAEFIRSTFFIPDARTLWQWTSRTSLKRAITENKIDAIYSSSPPYTCALIGKQAKKQTGLKWVAGFRDPWTDFLTTPKRWAIPKLIDKKLERSVFQEADAIECAWEGIIKDALNKYPDLDKNKFVHIPNGFDSEDFLTIDSRFLENDKEMNYKLATIKKTDDSNNSSKFILTYAGSMYGRRNPKSLLDAINNLLKQEKIERNLLKLRFIGRFGQDIYEVFDKSGLQDIIETIPYLPHSESIKKLIESDALLLVIDEAKESEEIVPGKVYEYIGVRKPILALGPKDSAIARLLKETNSGKIAHQTDIHSIGNIYLEYYTNWCNNLLLIVPNDDEINKYERRQLTKKLAELLDRVVG